MSGTTPIWVQLCLFVKDVHKILVLKKPVETIDSACNLLAFSTQVDVSYFYGSLHSCDCVLYLSYLF